MLREIVKAKTNEISITIPDCYVNKELELILFEIHEGKDAGEISNSIKTKDIENIFSSAKNYPIDSNVDITRLTEGMNDDLF